MSDNAPVARPLRCAAIKSTVTERLGANWTWTGLTTCPDNGALPPDESCARLCSRQTEWTVGKPLWLAEDIALSQFLDKAANAFATAAGWRTG